MDAVLSAVDRLARALAGIAMALFLVLVFAMLYEVVARRGFNSPTVWAFDIAYMTNGTMVFLGAAYALLRNEHIRIDFLSTQFPRRAQDAVNAAFYLLALIPALGYVAVFTVNEAWRTFLTGEVERASTWGPVSWPFYSGLALGIVGLWLQAVVQMIRHLRAATGRAASPLDSAVPEGR
ncbi:MAG: TRAP transporter small permease subunit [Rhodospirillales bacterium]